MELINEKYSSALNNKLKYWSLESDMELWPHYFYNSNSFHILDSSAKEIEVSRSKTELAAALGLQLTKKCVFMSLRNIIAITMNRCCKC